MPWVKINKNYNLRFGAGNRQFASFQANSIPIFTKKDWAAQLVEAGVAEQLTKEQAMEMKAVVTGAEVE